MQDRRTLAPSADAVSISRKYPVNHTANVARADGGLQTVECRRHKVQRKIWHRDIVPRKEDVVTTTVKIHAAESRIVDSMWRMSSELPRRVVKPAASNRRQ